MFTRLTGNEAGLFAYYDFEDTSAIAPPRAAGGNANAAKDLGPNGYDLTFGGCAPCADPFRAWEPYAPAFGVVAPVNGSSDPSGAPGYRVCLPSAKEQKSPKFQVAPTYGGAPCYGSNPVAEYFPQRLPSSAPISGVVFEQIAAAPAQKITIQLNGTDPDTDDIPSLRHDYARALTPTPA
jgi:hypothetical protein